MNDVIEHFDYEQIVRFMNIILEKIPKGCRLCMQFPNMSSPFGLRNYFSDHTHKTALTEIKMSGVLNKFNEVDFYYLGVEEIERYNLTSFIGAFVYWKFAIKFYRLFAQGSIGWNKYFFNPNILCVVSKQ